MKIDGFDWDAGNSIKNEEKHGISRESIELFFQEKPWIGPDLKHSDVAGKHMIVAFTFRIAAETGKRLIRPISARYMHHKEVLKYEQAFAQNKHR